MENEWLRFRISITEVHRGDAEIHRDFRVRCASPIIELYSQFKKV